MLIKASFVLIAPGDRHRRLGPQLRARHRQALRDLRRQCRVVLDIGGDKSLAATITAHSAKALASRPASRPTRCSTPRTSSSPSIENGRTVMKPIKFLAAAIGLFAGWQSAAATAGRPTSRSPPTSPSRQGDRRSVQAEDRPRGGAELRRDRASSTPRSPRTRRSRSCCRPTPSVRRRPSTTASASPDSVFTYADRQAGAVEQGRRRW